MLFAAADYPVKVTVSMWSGRGNKPQLEVGGKLCKDGASSLSSPIQPQRNP